LKKAALTATCLLSACLLSAPVLLVVTRYAAARTHTPEIVALIPLFLVGVVLAIAALVLLCILLYLEYLGYRAEEYDQPGD